MTINLEVNAQKLTCLTNKYIAADTVNYIDCKFSFSEEWNGFVKTAVFSNGTENYSVLLEDDKCMIPKEVLSGVFGISVYGTQTDADYKRITSDIVYITVYDSGYIEGQTPEAPTPDVYETIAAQYADCKERLNICKKELEKYNANKIKVIPHTQLSGNPIAITNALADEQPLEMRVYGCKNLIPYPYADTTKTSNGITFTDNGDGSITADGTATDIARFYLARSIALKKGTYTLSGCPSGGSLSTYRLSGFSYADNGGGVNFLLTQDKSDWCVITIFPGTTVKNITFKPQLELGTTATEYEIGAGIGDSNNGKYEIPINITGKNMFDISKITKFVSAADYTTVRQNYASVEADGTITNTIGRAADSMVYHDSKMTLAQGTYTLSADCMFISDNSGLLQVRIGVRDMTNSKWLEKPVTLKALNVKERIYHTFTVDSDTEIAINIQGVGVISNYKMNLKISDIQLERGNAATEYEPYREQTAAAILDTPLSGSEYIDLVSKKRNGETNITVSGNIELFDEVNKITCQTATAPSKLEVSYYQDINKILEELKNAS